MMKNILYGSIAFFFIILSICAVIVTKAYNDYVHKPKAKASLHEYVTYEQQVDSPKEAVELFRELKDEMNNR